jgi:predicted permease
MASSLVQDLRYARRSLAKKPGFLAVALATLALGVGVNVTVFSWIESVLLNPFPAVPEAHRLVAVETVAPSGDLIDSSYPDYLDWKKARSFSGVLAFKERPLDFRRSGAASVSAPSATQRVWSECVSGDFFDVLGLSPERGRFFSADEARDVPGIAPVAVLSHDFWSREYGGDSSAIGRTIELNRRPFTVIGVAPKGFLGTNVGLGFDVYVPIQMQSVLTGDGRWLESRRSRPLHLLARLAPGETVESASAEMSTIAGRLAGEYPESNREIGVRVLPLWKASYGAGSVLRSVLQILMAAAAVVLLIVCANLANLLLAMGTGRRREIGIRLALGATRSRLLRQLLTEGALVALAGGVAGALLAVWTSDLLRALGPPTDLPIALAAGLDLRVLFFAFSLALAAGLAFAIVPAWTAVRPDAASALADGTRGSASSGREGNRARGLLVVSEVALALVALAGAGLFVKSFRNSLAADPGFDAKGVLLAGVNLASDGYDRAGGLTFYRRLADRLSRLPRTRVAFSEDVPLGLSGGSWEDLEIAGYAPGPNENMKILRNLVSPGYFDLLRIPLRAGRDFDSHDGSGPPDGPIPTIVNEEFVRRFFAGRPPLGRTFRGWGRDLTVVGVVGDIKHRSIAEKNRPYFYVPFERFYRADTGITVHLKGAEPLDRLALAVRREIRAVDPNVWTITLPMSEYVAASAFERKLAASLLSVLAGLALVLAAVGLYSVVAYSVARRTAEIGVRMALGASPRAILLDVLLRSLRLVAVGLVAGLVATLALARLAASVLYRVESWDPFVLAGVCVLLAGIAAAASMVPGIRASRIDPASALRDA